MKKSLFIKTFLLASFLGAFSSYAGDFNGSTKAFRLPSNITANDYIPNKIIVKVKPEFRYSLTENNIDVEAVKTAFKELGISSMQLKFPHAARPETEYNSWGAKMADITIIYNIEFTANVDLAAAINRLISTNVFQYVEPWYLPHTTYLPNDPSNTVSGQYYLKKIKCDSAWDPAFGNQQGNPTVIIGIVDSGTDPLHPDLTANMVPGWDVSDNDNNPTVGSLNHGAQVSGCAAAVTNNGVGISSPGFNCKFMPVKAATNSSTGSIDHGYEGIVYAADNGCQIINCSWGGPGFDQSGQDVVTYATINKNALLICSAGNDNSETIQYPAAYDYVLNVGATTSSDVRASFSSYGTWVGISAPGTNIYTTSCTANGASHTYASGIQGTSFSSPITAGAAGLVKSKFPSYNPLQIAAQLRATADNIYGIAGNASYIGKLGSGRVNVYRALTATNVKNIGISKVVATDLNDEAFVIGDTLRISGDITNYLTPASNLIVTMSSTSPYVTVLNNTLNVGSLATMATTNNAPSPFTAKILPGTPLNATVAFTFTFTDGTYTSTAGFSVVVNVDFINITVNDVWTTATSKGWMAFNDPIVSSKPQGLGFVYQNRNLSYEIGFMAGTDATHVSDNIRNSGTTSTADTDLKSVANVKQLDPSPIGADFESSGIFDDSGNASTLNLLVGQKSYAWSSAADRKYVIVQYNIKNNGASALTNFYAGLFSDWDIGVSGKPDVGGVDKPLKLGYIRNNVTNGLYGGIKLLSHGGFNHYAIDNDAAGCTGVNIYSGYTDAQKYTTLSTSKDNAGGCGASDVAHVVSSGPFTVNAGDSIIVAFAILAGNNLADLQTSAGNAQIKYDGLFTGIHELSQAATAFGIQSVVPNPSSGVTTFNFSLDAQASTQLSIYNEMGQKICTLLNEKMQAGVYRQQVDLSPYHLQSGIYFYRLQSGDNSATGKLTIVH